MITRFAPSPTGPLHLGHAYSALLAQDMARSEGGECLLRIEDIDASRARAGWETQIFEDLRWLGFQWSQPVMRQSERLAIYAATIEDLWKRDWVFACQCSRRDVLDAASAPQEGASPAIGPDGVIYPGTCRINPRRQVAETRPSDAAFRLNLTQKLADDPTVFSFLETGEGPNGETGTINFTAAQAISDIGDIVLARRDMGTSYHLSVVLDDAAQGITHVTRGQDTSSFNMCLGCRRLFIIITSLFATMRANALPNAMMPARLQNTATMARHRMIFGRLWGCLSRPSVP